MIPRDTVDKIFSAAKIEEVVGDYVSLKRRGANMIGLCPFHDEKTGSFTVSPSKQIYKCFGCGKSGSVVGFIMESEQCNYYDALKLLAKKYHIEIEERELTADEKQRQDDRESMFVVNETANLWFQNQLWETDEGNAIGLRYLRERGLQDTTIRKFRLGYSPEKGNPLTREMMKKGFKEKYLVNDVETKIGTGVCGRSSEDGRIYDRFRDRIIFPIQSVSGKTVAFAGRILKSKENTGKYVNSPDSIIYSKTRELYGLSLAKQAIVKYDLCYLVEGQMDVISMHQSGIENVVASGGTALTKAHIRLIHRFTSNVTVIYDGDNAGIHAALRGIDMFLEEGINVRVLLLPNGEDPDSFARSHNASDFIAYIQSNQTDFIRYKTQLLSAEAGNDPILRSRLIQSIVQSISLIPDTITRQVYIKDCAELLHMQEEVLMGELTRMRLSRKEEQLKKGPSSVDDKEQIADIRSNTDSDKSVNHQPPSNPLPDVISRKDNHILSLLRLIVRYGDRVIGQDENGNPIMVGEYIVQNIKDDDIHPDNPLYVRVFDEYVSHCNEPNFVAETFFVHHSDLEISQLAVDLVADRYQLSKIFSKQFVSENVVQEVKMETDADVLPDLVQRLLIELKLVVVSENIDNAQAGIIKAQDNQDWDEVIRLMKEKSQWEDIMKEISNYLGR